MAGTVTTISALPPSATSFCIFNLNFAVFVDSGFFFVQRTRHVLKKNKSEIVVAVGFGS